MSTRLEELRKQQKQLQDRLNDVIIKIRDEEEHVQNCPQTFHVVLEVVTKPIYWGLNCLNVEAIQDHFREFHADLVDALSLTDEEDKIRVINVTEVT